MYVTNITSKGFTTGTKKRTIAVVTRLPSFFALPTMRATRPAFRFKLYPTGEFSATRVKETLAIVPSAYQEGMAEALGAIARVYDRHGSSMPHDVRPSAQFYSECVPPLGLSKVSKNHKPVKPRGRRGMTRYGKRLIVNSAYLLEKTYGRKQLSFLTLTLPGECANGAGETYQEAKRQMLQWLSRNLALKGLPQKIIGCTELQSSRYANSGSFALHEHWLFVGRKPYSSWSFTPGLLQRQWLKILRNVYNVSIPKESSQSALNIQRVKKAAGAYLGKYMSKCESVVKVAIENGDIECLPHSWVSKTSAMLKQFQQSISILNGGNATFWLDYLSGDGSIMCRWKRHLYVKNLDGMEIWIAFVGWLSGDGLKLFESLH